MHLYTVILLWNKFSISFVYICKIKQDMKDLRRIITYMANLTIAGYLNRIDKYYKKFWRNA